MQQIVICERYDSNINAVSNFVTSLESIELDFGDCTFGSAERRLTVTDTNFIISIPCYCRFPDDLAVCEGCLCGAEVHLDFTCRCPYLEKTRTTSSVPATLGVC